MSRHRMTGAAETIRAANGPRAELMLQVRDPHDRRAEVWRHLAVLAAAPAVEGVVYAAGMTVDLGTPMATGSACSGVVITDSGLAPIGTGVGPVAVLRASPAPATELAWCRVRGSAALLERWTEAGTDLLDLARPAVRLD